MNAFELDRKHFMWEAHPILMKSLADLSLLAFTMLTTEEALLKLKVIHFNHL